MILIDEILISEKVVEQSFHCNLHICKGACCYEGDYGAPLEEHEQQLLNRPPQEILSYLDDQAREKIEKEGGIREFKEEKSIGTNLMDNGDCAFLFRNEIGIINCSIETAYKEGKIPFNKPISCHLYPVRVSKNELTGFEALNYDEWDICKSACDLGEKKGMPLYLFVKDAIIRKYGEEFFEALDGAAKIKNNE